MERYEAYKDSGVEWIGEIPTGWDVNKLGNLGSYINGYAFKPDQWGVEGLPIIRIQDLTGSNDSPNYYSGEIDEKHLVNKGDLLVSWAATIGVYWWTRNPGWLNQHIFRVIPLEDTCDKQFFYWMLNAAIDALDNENKHGIMMEHLTLAVFNAFKVPLPSMREQHAISDYLDAKTAEIDALVSDCEREVGLLQEYRKAVISEAVTKGLDPDAPMKDSGIKWIGKYPASWEYLKLGYTFDRLFDIDHWMPQSVNEEYPYLMIGDLEELASRIDFENCKHISEEDYLGLAVKGTPKRGDVIIARYATIGTGCFVDIDEPFIVTYACLTVTPKRESMRGRYLLYYTQSDAFERELFMLTNSNTQGNVGKDSLSKAHILLPPIDEQDEIVSALDASIGKIDKLIESKQSMAAKLREYRRSLISEAVTGKFKVPGV